MHFFLNSLYFKSRRVFNEYDELFWSKFVQNEFNHRFFIKQKNLRSFFKDLQKYFENQNQEFYSVNDLKRFALNNYSGKIMEDVESSITPFWNEFFGIESYISFSNLRDAINFCLKDLSITLNNHKKQLQNIMQLTPQRTNDYGTIDKMLKKHGVKDEDRIVTLDGHDFACFCSSSIDFVTFDYDCFKGASNVDILCFDSVKGKDDFIAS